MALIPSVDVGDEIRIGNHTVTAVELASGVLATDREPFVDADGSPTDPDQTFVRILKPDGTVLEYGFPTTGNTGFLFHETTGRFYIDEQIDQPNRWEWYLVGTGASQTSTGTHEFWAKGQSF